MGLRAGRFVVVPQAALLYVTSREAVVTAYAVDGTRYWSDRPLADLEARLDPQRFYRLDASHLVNVTHVAELEPWPHQRYRLAFADTRKSELMLSRDVGRRLRAAAVRQVGVWLA